MMFFSSVVTLFIVLTLSLASPNTGKNIQKRSSKDCQKKKDKLSGIMFIASEEYDGRFYYLSVKGIENKIETARRLCELIDGYLVEIDNERELTFLRKFLIRHSTGITGVFIAGNDQLHEGEFKFHRSGRPVRFKFFAEDYPQKKDNNDCITLDSKMQWKMIDIRCTHHVNFRFLCEVPKT